MRTLLKLLVVMASVAILMSGTLLWLMDEFMGLGTIVFGCMGIAVMSKLNEADWTHID